MTLIIFLKKQESILTIEIRYNLSSDNIDRVHYFLRDQNSIIRVEFTRNSKDIIDIKLSIENGGKNE